MWDCTGTMEGTNNFVSLIADTIRMDENEKKILIRFANNVLKMDYLRPIFKEEYVLLAYGKVTQNCIAARINCTQPYVKMFYDKAKKSTSSSNQFCKMTKQSFFRIILTLP